MLQLISIKKFSINYFKSFSSRLSKRGLELIYNSEVSETEIFVDEYSATQIFVNLIDNAIKYTKTGKVEILLSKKITGNIIVEIKDTGIGIAKEFLPRLFDFFVKKNKVTQEVLKETVSD
ncbi:MAG: HAMP domain-containing sensor histidine kinase [Melioribacteraceae bacterium]|nr:HAMP domain-containing sensor histidine kinase [Melioribacteraceae bacterium]